MRFESSHPPGRVPAGASVWAGIVPGDERSQPVEWALYTDSPVTGSDHRVDWLRFDPPWERLHRDCWVRGVPRTGGQMVGIDLRQDWEGDIELVARGLDGQPLERWRWNVRKEGV